MLIIASCRALEEDKKHAQVETKQERKRRNNLTVEQTTAENIPETV